MRYTQTNYASKKEILKFPDHFVAKAVMVDDEGIPVEDGKKIVKAGTIVGGKTQPNLSNPNEPVSEKNTEGTTGAEAEGILLNDVDVTYGQAPGAMLIHAFVDVSKLPAPPSTDAKTALKQITFM